MTKSAAEQAIADRIADKFWVGRALDVFRTMTEGPTYTTVSGLRIDPRWPICGAKIAFTRDSDGGRVTIQMRGKKFVAVCS